jgi:micrococcal nuclease
MLRRMAHPVRRALLSLLALVALLAPAGVVAQSALPPTPPEDGEPALVVDVIDGDTIRVEREDGTVERVRYIGVDTPEIGHGEGEPDEPFGREAMRANAGLVADELVLLERDVSDRDRYERLLRYVWVEEPAGWTMVNGALVTRGLAEVRAYEPDTRHHEWFVELRDEAIEAGVGMYGATPEAESGGLLQDLLDFLFGG